MSRLQYTSNCAYWYGLKEAINKEMRTMIQGIGRKRVVIGRAKIYVPLTRWMIITDVEVLILKEDVTSLLRMKEMFHNKLEISIQDR